MSTSPTGKDIGDLGSPAANRLLAQTERILALWEADVRKEIAAAESETHPILTNTFPAIIRQLAESISPVHPRRTATEGNSLAEEHGGERVRMTKYRLEDLIVEYAVLRRVLFNVLEEDEPLSSEDRHTLNASIDATVKKACGTYTLVQTSFRERFFAILAHDMRTPLASARANTGLILRKPGSDNVARWAARSVDAIDRVDRMLQDLLDAMRLDAGAQLPLDLTPTDLVQVARAAIETLTAEYGDRFVLKAPDPVNGYFGVDPMRRAIENLAANAVKYGLEGRPITISVEAEHERALLAVHNQGPAIPPNELETLFVAFRRTHSSEQSHKRGWGLGLAQVRGVAEAHGGSIDVESLPDTGTRFIISVPLDPRPYQKQILTTDGITLKNPTSE